MQDYKINLFIVHSKELLLKFSETTWDPPDNYVSLAEQEKNKIDEKEEQKKEKKLK